MEWNHTQKKRQKLLPKQQQKLPPLWKEAINFVGQQSQTEPKKKKMKKKNRKQALTPQWVNFS